MSRISPTALENAYVSAQATGMASPAPVLQSVRVAGTVHGLLLEMSVEQAYANPGSAPIEIAYSFPLPHDAVLLGLEFELGEHRLPGRVVARADAEEQYEAALESGNTAVMLERAADGVYTASVGNLLAHEKAVVRLRYAQLLSLQQEQVRITVPTVIALRAGDPAAARLRLHQVPVHEIGAAHPFSLSMRLHGPIARGRISSPSHALAVRQAEPHFEVSLAQPELSTLDRDFVLLSDGLGDAAIATLGRDGEGYVALASFCPAPESPGPALPLNLKILVDCSGSMNGDSMKGARKALHEILARLNPADRFSYSRFGSHVVHHSRALMAATPRAVLEGSEWIAQTAASMGNTEMREALLSTLALGQPMRADILLVTDGDVWDTDPLVASAEKSGQRIFAVGVGAAPAASLLQRLARGTGGACELIGANDDVHAAVLRMFRRMRQAPVNEAAVTWEGGCEWATPAREHVFSGETVHAFAGFATAPPAGARFTCHDSHERKWRQEISYQGDLVDGDALARVAAAHRLQDLAAGPRHALAMAYQLVSDTTSLLVLHRRAEEERPAIFPSLRVVPQMLVAGRSGMGSVPRVKSVAVWRREAFSGQGPAMTPEAVEHDEKPAFLRRQSGVVPFIYREQLRVFLYKYAAVLDGGPCPATFAEVDDALPRMVLQELRDIAESGHAPQDVLREFVVALHRCFCHGGIAQRLMRRIRRIGTPAIDDAMLARRLAALATTAYEARHGHASLHDIPEFLRKRAD